MLEMLEAWLKKNGIGIGVTPIVLQHSKFFFSYSRARNQGHKPPSAMTSDNNLELFKLDITDRRVLFWMMDRNPNALLSWITYIAEQYARKNKLLIDPDKLFQEVIIELPEEKAAGMSNNWRPKNVLLVDDESIFNFLHKRMLELTGVADQISVSMNGTEAIEFLKSKAIETKLPDVIILDLSMPVMDGFAFLDALHALDVPNKQNITVIVITSSINGADRVRAKELGITHYLIKPVDERELCAAVLSA